MQKLAVIVRDFQAGAGRTKPFDEADWRKKAEKVVAMATALSARVYIVSCRDVSSPYSEAPNQAGYTPTWQAYQRHFNTQIEKGMLVYTPVDDWGQNLGSGRALQTGIDQALVTNAEYIMTWSTKMSITPEQVTRAIEPLEENRLDGIGFLRAGFEESPQWLLPQHTGFVANRHCWLAAPIPRYTDGDDGREIETAVGTTLLAGMEDMARIFEAKKVHPGLRFGMIGKNQPVPWRVDASQDKKIARQWQVVLEWARRAFPHEDPEAVLEAFIQSLVLLDW